MPLYLSAPRYLLCRSPTFSTCTSPLRVPRLPWCVLSPPFDEDTSISWWSVSHENNSSILLFLFTRPVKYDLQSEEKRKTTTSNHSNHKKDKNVKLLEFDISLNPLQFPLCLDSVNYSTITRTYRISATDLMLVVTAMLIGYYAAAIR